MYADRMRNIKHPTGKPLEVEDRIGPRTYFACIDAINYGALPSRTRTGSLDFTVEKGTFYATIHEINAGLETGTLKILKVKHAWDFDTTSTFQTFIDYFQSKKEQAQREGDVLGYLFYKRLQNACYGKMAQDPDAYLDCVIVKGCLPSAIGKTAARILVRPTACLYDAMKGNVFKYGNFSHD